MEQVFDVRDLIITLEGIENEDGAKKRNVVIEIDSNINCHSMLKLKYLIAIDEYEIYMDYIRGNKKDISISIVTKDEDGEIEFDKLVFYGLVKKISLIDTIDGILCTFEGISKSYLLDKEKRNISYQDIAVTFGEIIERINSNYETISVIADEFNQMPQDKLLIQYNETDWEFLLRVSSEYHLGLQNIGMGIRIGYNRNGNEMELLDNNMSLSMSRSNEYYMEYHIDTTMVYILGNKVVLTLEDESIDLMIKDSKIKINDTNVECRYNLVNPMLYKREGIKNVKLAGKALEGKVVEILDVEGIAKMKVTFNTELSKREEELGIDVQLGTELFEFPYVTPYSQSHTGYFCTPEVDDNVIVYFPDEIEEHGYVLGAVNSIGNGRFTNRVDRNFIIPTEEEEGEPLYEMNLNSDIFKFKTSAYIKEIMNEEIRVEENSLLSITGNKSVNIEGNIDYAVNGNFSYNVEQDYQIQAENIKTKANSNFNGEGGSAMNLKGGQMNIEGKSASNIKGGSVKIGGGSVSVGS